MAATTPAGEALRSIMSSSNGGGKKKHQKKVKHTKKPYEDSTSDDDTTSTDISSSLATRNLRRMKPGVWLDPYRYFYSRMTGRGDVIRALGGKGVIGETTTLSSPSDPQFLQRGPRRFGGSQPGSERLNFLPQPDIYTLIKSDKIIYINPNQTPVPGFNDLIHFELEQQPGLFYDGQTFELIGSLQMYYKDHPWHEGGATAVEEKTRKCISPVNNIFASLFKSLTVTVNNQQLITFDYSHMHYLSTLLETDLDDYQNGLLSDQGFFKETPGHLAEWNCYTANGQPPKNDNNPARAQLCSLFFSGAEREFRM